MTPPSGGRVAGSEDLGRVGVGVTDVGDHRPADVARQRDEAPVGLALRVARRMVVVIVEPGLADADHARRTAEHRQLVPVGLGHARDVVGVHADGGKDVRLSRRQAHRLTRRADIPAGADADHDRDARRTGARQDLGPIRAEVGNVEMAVCVNHVQSIRLTGVPIKTTL